MLKKLASSVLEEESLLAVQRVVASMGHQWRRPTPDNSGFDGEIEIVRTGGIMSARIIRVQVKAGESFRSSESTTALRISIEQKYWEHWSDANTPVILLYYDPRNKLIYWLDVHLYVSLHPEVLRSGKKNVLATFDKKSDVFDTQSGPAITSLVAQSLRGVTSARAGGTDRPVPESIPRLETELVRSNWLPVLELPRSVWCRQSVVGSLDAIPQSFSEEHPCIVREGRIWTFADLSRPDSALSRYATGWDIESHDPKEVKQTYVVELLHRCLLARFVALGCIPLPQRHDGRRFTFPREMASSEKKYPYLSLRGRRESRAPVRVVVIDGVRMLERLAVEVSIRTLADQHWLELDPSHIYAARGGRNDKARNAGISDRQNTHNEAYLHLVNFWEELLSGGEATISIPVDVEEDTIRIVVDRRVHVETNIIADTDYRPPQKHA